jgi:glycosyltransferase involved in cell wall biosynthesis
MGEKPRGDPRPLLSGLSYSEKWKHDIKCDVAYVFYHPFCSLNFRIKGKRVASFHSEAFTKRIVPFRYGIIPIAASYGTRILNPIELSRFDAVHVHYPQSIIKHKNVFVIPHWVDTETFRPRSKKDDDFSAIYVGRAVWQKGWEAFLWIAKRLKDFKIRCKYVGGWISDKFVESLGYISDPVMLSKIYSSSHVMINPSSIGGVGKAVMESLACGTPVIARQSPDIKYLKLPILESKEVREYVSYVLEVKEMWEKGVYENVSRECRTSVERYSYDSVVNMFESMFQTVINFS